MDHVTRLVFFGSGPVAAQSLELLAQNFTIEAVVTKPKPAHHHGNFPVLDVAESLNLKVYTVSNKAELSSLITTEPFSSQLGVLIDFGIIVAQDTIDYFPLGIINSHFSLLPQWRGADPITFSILSGQKQTGVSLMLLVEAMDEGPLLAQGIQEITGDETTPSLTKKLVYLSDALLRDAVPKYLSKQISARSQETVAEMMQLPSKPTYSRKLAKQDGKLDWTKPAEQLEREIRAYAEWPKSYTSLAEKDVIITKAHVDKNKQNIEEKSQAAGSVVATDDKAIMVKTSKDWLVIDTLKPAGKKEMTAKEFLLGYGQNL